MQLQPYKAEGPHQKTGWWVTGPYIHGSSMGTIPKFTQAMPREDAVYLMELLNKAYAAGHDTAQRAMRSALGVND